MGEDIKALGKPLPLAPKAFITLEPEVGEKVEAQINPKDFKFSKTTKWSNKNAAGRDFPDLQWTEGEPIKISGLELLFDGYETDTDVRSFTNALLTMAMRHEDLHRPPTVKVSWGGPLLGDSFKAVVTQVDVTYTMFNAEGTPVRAKATVSMQQAEGEVMSANSPDIAKKRTVKRGETLQSIALTEYHDASEWRRIADANKIDDPLGLQPGMNLIIPPILIR